ncbi:MAG: hypothetical protein O7E52_24390 [Candidatus Poribacteria bacterium]|nr:hypothetical protein [Candidatus Poribacteria bacterium]
MAGADLREKLDSGGIVYGTMLSLSRNPRWAGAIGRLKVASEIYGQAAEYDIV